MKLIESFKLSNNMLIELKAYLNGIIKNKNENKSKGKTNIHKLIEKLILCRRKGFNNNEKIENDINSIYINEKSNKIIFKNNKEIKFLALKYSNKYNLQPKSNIDLYAFKLLYNNKYKELHKFIQSLFISSNKKIKIPYFLTKNNIKLFNSIAISNAILSEIKDKFMHNINIDINISSINTQFYFNEVISAIYKLNKSAATGNDLLSAKIISSIIDASRKDKSRMILFGKKIVDFINYELHNNKNSEIFNISLTIIPKKSNKITDLNNLRIIGITSWIYKIIELIILKRLKNNDNNITSKISNNQYGFTDINSCDKALNRFRNLVREISISNNNIVYVLQIDLKNAFDNVCHSKLFDTLENKFKINGRTLNLIKKLYQNSKGIFYNNIFKINCGVIQGGILSPLLFNAYINSLIENSKHNVIAYADDLIYVLKSKKEIDNVIIEINDWSKEYKILINKNKSNYMIIDKNNNDQNKNDNENNNNSNNEINGIKEVNNIEYLGIHFNKNMNRYDNIPIKFNKVKKIITKLIEIKDFISLPIKKLIIDTYIKSRIFYGSSSIEYDNFKELIIRYWKMKELILNEKEKYYDLLDIRKKYLINRNIS